MAIAAAEELSIKVLLAAEPPLLAAGSSNHGPQTGTTTNNPEDKSTATFAASSTPNRCGAADTGAVFGFGSGQGTPQDQAAALSTAKKARRDAGTDHPVSK
jgi:hypothetical protein